MFTCGRKREIFLADEWAVNTFNSKCCRNDAWNSFKNDFNIIKSPACSHFHSSYFLYMKITLVCRARKLDKTIKIFILSLLIWCNAITRSKLSWHNDSTKKIIVFFFIYQIINVQRLKSLLLFYFFVHCKVNGLVSHQIQNIWSALHLEWILIRLNCNIIHLSTAFLYCWFNYSH